jgi:hypothetical protein
MFRTDLENQMTRIDETMTKISEKTAELKTAADITQVRLATIQKLFGAGNLRKIAAGDLADNLFAVKNLLKVMSDKIGDIKKLQVEARASQALARLALPDYAKWYSEGKQDTVPGRVYFSADRGAASPTPFMPAQKSTVPMASAASAALSHRTVSKGD